MSVSESDEEDPAACFTGETDREARRPNAPQSPSPTEFVTAILQEPFGQGLDYAILLEETDGQEDRRLEDPDLIRRPGGEIRGLHATQPPPPEAQAGMQTRGVEVRIKKLPPPGIRRREPVHPIDP